MSNPDSTRKLLLEALAQTNNVRRQLTTQMQSAGPELNRAAQVAGEVAVAIAQLQAAQLNLGLMAARLGTNLDEMGPQADAGFHEGIHMCVDAPRPGRKVSGTIVVEGWAAAETGVYFVEVVLPNGVSLPARTGRLRTDIGVLFPQWKDSRVAGFRAAFPSEELGAGTHTLTVNAFSRRGTVLSSSVTVEVSPPAHTRTVADIRALIDKLKRPVHISVLLPVFNIAERWLRRAIDSVLTQQYPHWELCISDDCSSEPHIRAVLEEYAARDARIRVKFRTERGHIAHNSNSALALATSEFVALLDHDDELSPDALLEVAMAIDSHPDADMLYSDEDKMDEEGLCTDPFYKPDWSPEYFTACMYTCHLGVYRTSLVRDIGGFRPEVNGAQDYDMVLRLVSRTNRIVHIPRVLYHWRTLPTSTAAGGDAKDYAYPAAQRALRNYFAINGVAAEVLPGPRHGFHTIRYAIQDTPKVSIVIPTAARVITYEGRRKDLIVDCVRAIIERSTWKNLQIVVIDNGDLSASQRDYLEPRVLRTTYTSPKFNLAEKINLGVASADGEHLIILNDDIDIISPDWIERLLEYSQQSDVGAVGPKLMFPNGRVQHAGVHVLGGNPCHPYYNHPREEIGYFLSAIVQRNYVAVTGACMMTRRSLFTQYGGFDESFPLNFNDVDYCLKLHQAGFRIVYQPDVEIYHYESVSREGAGGVGEDELRRFHQRWLSTYPHDPYYNPNLPSDYPYYTLD